jgi:DNA excision repair protein ERCC-2
MRIDYEKRTISCSVNDIVTEATFKRPGVDRGEGFRRMWLGQEIHSRRAEFLANEDPNYRPELPVSMTLEQNGWTVEIKGRIDGVSIDKENRRVLLEEVKSLHFDLELAALYRSDKLQRFLFQLMLYALFLAEQESFSGYIIEARLALIDLVTEDVRLVDAPYDAHDVREALQGAVRRLVDTIEAEKALRLAKRAFAEGLDFPFEDLRPRQDEMIETVARAVRERETLLVSAPTGIGKTIAAIYPALRESLRLGKKLFFLTPKVLQQETAVAALKLLNDGSFRTLRIRAKKKMCAHTEVICHEDFCPYAKQYAEKMERNGLVARIETDHTYFDPDLVFEMSKSEEVCPFEVSLSLINRADVIVCDYNYVFDPYVGLKSFSEDGDFGDSVMIIDEAHNLVDRGRGYYSPEITEAGIAALKWHLACRPGSAPDGWEDLVEDLLQEIANLSELVAKTGDQSLCEFSRRFFMKQRSEWERIVLQYMTWKIQHKIAEEEDPIVDFYFKLVKFTNLLQEDGDEFAHIVERTADGIKLKIFCKDASKFLGETIGSAYAVIAMSATLEPFTFYRDTLGFPRDRCSELALPSPFPPENRKIVVVSDVDTTYKSRDKHYERIAELVTEIGESTPGNFLALFPSYVFLDQVAMRMPVPRKRLLIQRSDMLEYERQAVLSALREPGTEGSLVLAVAGGMYAEGIDYQGDMLSGVVVVGPALPGVSFEQELLKQYFDDMYGSGFEYAYLVPGMTRVVQSAGRVIRSERDIGIIALLCKRFTFESYNRYFPTHWYERSPRELVSKKPVDEIRSFFDEKRPGQLRLRLQ